MMTLGAIVAGFILDLIFGDPHWLPHPICLIGNLIGFLDKKLRRMLAPGETALLLGGALMVIIVLVLTFAVPYAVLTLAEQVNPWLRFALETVMCYQIFATKCLRDESMKVYTALKDNDLVDARLKLSWIVGRDTKELDAAEVTKGAVETVAENTSDGIIAPIFYMAVGGPVLMYLYKGINTMDSMVAYKNDKYLHFGWCAAKLDDIANFIPARISAFLMILAAFVCRLDWKNAWRIFKRDRYNHASPNSAQTEAVMAGALDVALAGNAYYFGKLYEKKTIGDAIRKIKPDDIILANRMLYVAATIGVILFAVIRILLQLI